MKEEMPLRKRIRLKDYDYSQEGQYFITICTKDRQELLGKIKYENNVGDAVHGVPQIELSKIGKILKENIEQYNERHNESNIGEYIIMPNHIHMIVQITDNHSTTIPKVINSFKTYATKKIGYSIWQRNYYEHVIRNEKDYWKIVEYIRNNPMNWEIDKAD